MTQSDRQRARRDLAEGRTGPGRARRDSERRAELLIAEVLSVLSQRDVLVAGLEQRAGRCLAEILALGWPSTSSAAAACGLTVRESARLRGLVDATTPNGEPSRMSDGRTSVSDSEVGNGQHQHESSQ